MEAGDLLFFDKTPRRVQAPGQCVFLAAAAAVVTATATVIVVAAAAVAAAAEEDYDKDQNDDPPLVVPTAETGIAIHKTFLLIEIRA